MKTLLSGATLLLLACLSATPLRAEEPAPGPEAAPPGSEATTAAELGIEDTDEAVLLVLGADQLDRLTVGSSAAEQSESPSATLLVRDLKEGLISIRLEQGERVWEGSVRIYAGQVTTFDAAEALASSETTTLEQDGFDLFLFYDRMDSIPTLEAKLAYCKGVLSSQPPPPDDALVLDSCDRLERKLELQAETARDEEGPRDDELAEELLDEQDEEAERKLAQLKKLYLPDGRPRKHAPGTAARWTLAGLGFGATAAGAGLALHFETRAEQEYLLYRSAERVGDDRAMTRHLFVTRDLDRQRDASIGLAAACLTTGIAAALFQRLEAQRFERYKASIEAGDDDESR